MLTRNTLLSIAAWAGASCMVSMALLNPTGLQATDTPAKTEIDRPILHSDGCEISVRLGDGLSGANAALPIIGVTHTISAGTALSLALVARNTTDHSIIIDPMIRMTSAAQASPMARTMPIPSEIWKTTESITLTAGQTRTIELRTGINMPDRASVTVTMARGTESVVALYLATVAAPAKGIGAAVVDAKALR